MMHNDQYGTPPCTKEKVSTERISRSTRKSRSRSFANPSSNGSNARVRMVASSVIFCNTVRKIAAFYARLQRTQKERVPPSQARPFDGAQDRLRSRSCFLVLRTLHDLLPSLFPTPDPRPPSFPKGKRVKVLKVKASDIGHPSSRTGRQAGCCRARPTAGRPPRS